MNRLIRSQLFFLILIAKLIIGYVCGIELIRLCVKFSIDFMKTIF